MKMRKKLLGKLKINVKLAEGWSNLKIDDNVNLLCTTGKDSQDQLDLYPKITTDYHSYSSIPSNPKKYEILSCKRDNEIVWIDENLYIANSASAGNEEILNSNGITHIVNLVAHNFSNSYNCFKYLNLSVKDNPDADIIDLIPKIIIFISLGEKEIDNARFWFFWNKGVSRSVALLAAYMMYK